MISILITDSGVVYMCRNLRKESHVLRADDYRVLADCIEPDPDTWLAQDYAWTGTSGAWYPEMTATTFTYTP